MNKKWILPGLVLLVLFFAGCTREETTTTSSTTTTKTTTATTQCSPVSTPFTPCSETDDGIDPYKKGVTTGGVITIPETHMDECVNNTALREYFCYTATCCLGFCPIRDSSQIMDCPGGCLDGACQKNGGGTENTTTTITTTTDTGAVPGYYITTPPFCSDTDGGINSSIKGSVTVDIRGEGIRSSFKNQTDYCFDQSTLIEYACDCYGEHLSSCITEAIVHEDITCSGGCVDGACVKSP